MKGHDSVPGQRLALFPESTRVVRGGDGWQLSIGDCDLAGLSGRYGTPLYLYDAVSLETAVAIYFAALVANYPGRPGHVPGAGRRLAGLGYKVVQPFGLRTASFSPRICNMCENSVRKHEGGAEVDLALLFADVRGSTALADRVGTFEFQRLIRRFYETASKVVIEHNGLVNRLMGDQIIGIFVQRFAGVDYTGVAIEAGRSLLTATGHEEEAGPWIPVGAGVHADRAYVGAVGAPDGVNEIAVLGNTANLAARLSSAAGAGELYVSEEAALKAGLDLAQLALREMVLKGIEQPVRVGIMHHA